MPRASGTRSTISYMKSVLRGYCAGCVRPSESDTARSVTEIDKSRRSLAKCGTEATTSLERSYRKVHRIWILANSRLNSG